LHVVEPPPITAPRLVWTVAALVHAVADALASRFAVCTVRGELSAFSRASSGHCYFCLKDADGDAALMRCAMFRRTAGMLDFNPADGQLVELRGRLTVYEPRGELQFVVESMQRAGAGALFEQFLRLKTKLGAEGLFDAARKRELPAFPGRVGVVTSLGAAALRDVASALARRAPHVGVVIYPSLVQGPDAPAALVQAIELAGRRAEVDALIVCRGGGSLEDLWAFNDERVVRAIAASRIPVVCGVGHETDVTLADFAADLRAPTPTAAAELVAPATDACVAMLQGFATQMRRRARHLLDSQAQRLDAAAMRLARPGQAVRRQADVLGLLAHRLRASAAQAAPMRLARIEQQQDRLRRASSVLLSRHAQHLDALGARLTALDPKRVLNRGYAWLADESGQPVLSVAQMSLGQSLRAVLADGSATVRVTDIAAASPD
jgi:exodeoxyribonuclease VII large subunit